MRILPLLLLCVGCRTLDEHTVRKTIKVNDVERAYLLHLPPDAPKETAIPLVLVFHGGGVTAKTAEQMARWSELSHSAQFAAAYPEALNRHWNDGRENATKSHEDQVDDLAFAVAVIDAIAKERPIDPKRVFATGISNGAMFSHYLAASHADRIAAIAPCVGGLAEPVEKAFKPSKPVSVIIFQGTDDPLVPYAGGPVAKDRGRIVSTDEAVKKWAEHDKCAAKPVTEDVRDADPDDGCKVKRSTWAKGTDGAEVVLYRIEGGGHTWPGGAQYLPKAVIGRVCRDFDGTEVAWEFFRTHPRP